MDNNNDTEIKLDTLYTFWQEIPIIKYFNPDLFDMTGQTIRVIILDRLREGFVDIYGKENGLPKRHAFCGKELRDHIQLKLGYNSKISISLVYFHLNKLIENGFVKILGYITETDHSGRKHRIKYYARTAKLFLFGEDKDFEREKEEKEMVRQIVRKLNPSYDLDVLETQLETYYDKEHEARQEQIAWIKKNYNALIELDIDFMELINSPVFRLHSINKLASTQQQLLDALLLQ
jgi:hypothetical protein